MCNFNFCIKSCKALQLKSVDFEGIAQVPADYSRPRWCRPSVMRLFGNKWTWQLGEKFSKWKGINTASVYNYYDAVSHTGKAFWSTSHPTKSFNPS